MISTLTQNEISTQILGPAGKLELIYAKPHEAFPAWGIVCHPHPLYGGTMHNKVVTTLIKTFQSLNLATVRFNFRGVGQSAGQFDQGIGELADLMTVIDWAQQEIQKPIWLAGFSFGAYIALKAATQLNITKLVTIAPPVQHFAVDDLAPILCPWILAQGEQDDVVSPRAVLEWAEKRHPQPTILRFPEAGHFFHGQLTELRTRLIANLKD